MAKKKDSKSDAQIHQSVSVPYNDLTVWIDHIEGVINEYLAVWDEAAKLALESLDSLGVKVPQLPFLREAIETRSIIKKIRTANPSPEIAHLILGGFLMGRNFARLQNKQSEALLASNFAEKERMYSERNRVWAIYKQIRADARLSKMECYRKVGQQLERDRTPMGERTIREHIKEAQLLVEFAESLATR